jgi:hypothetical protein
MTAFLHPTGGVVRGALTGQRGTSGEGAGLLGERAGGLGDGELCAERGERRLR